MGRINRSTYLLRSILIGFAQFILFIFLQEKLDQGGSYEFSDPNIGGFVTFFFISTIVLIIIALYQVSMRLNDINLSGWISLLALIPILNLLGILLFFIPGTRGPNQYGEDPNGEQGEIIYHSEENFVNDKMQEATMVHPKELLINPRDTAFQLEINEVNSKIDDYNNKIKLLVDSYRENLITKIEYDNKVQPLLNENKILSNKQDELYKRKKDEESKKFIDDSIKDAVNKLKKLRDLDLITDSEYIKKVHILKENKKKDLLDRKKSEIKAEKFKLLIGVIFIIIIVVFVLYGSYFSNNESGNNYNQDENYIELKPTIINSDEDSKEFNTINKDNSVIKDKVVYMCDMKCKEYSEPGSCECGMELKIIEPIIEDSDNSHDH